MEVNYICFENLVNFHVFASKTYNDIILRRFLHVFCQYLCYAGGGFKFQFKRPLSIFIFSQGEMAETSDIVEMWRSVELSNQELSKLKEEVHHKIIDENHIALLPFHGFLQLKDKMWAGKVKLVTPGSALLETLRSKMKPVEFYFIECEHRIIDGMKSHGPAPQLEWGVGVFTFSLLSPTEDFQPIIENLGKYFLAVYGNCSNKDQPSLPLIMGLGGMLNEAWVGEHTLFRDIQATFKAKWAALRAMAFTAALRNPQSLLVKSFEHADYEVREMSLPETLYAVEHWKFATKSAKYRFACSQSLGMAVGAFESGSNSPVSWAFASWDGAIAALHTLPGHQRKGLAKTIVRMLSAKLIDIGLTPFVYIELIETSFVPESLFTSLGFELFRDIRFHWSQSC